MAVAAGSLLLLAALAAIVGLIVRRPAPEAISSLRLAVLPFQTIGLPSAEHYLGLAIADAVITRLSGIGGIDVRPTSLVRQFDEEPADLAAIGRLLEVTSLLRGSVERNNDSIQIRVQLINADTKAVIWAQSFEHRSSSLLEIEDEIAERVTDTLQVRLGLEDRERLRRRHTTQSDAYRAYLKGRYYWNQHRSYRTAMQEFQRALDVDPAYAPAYAGLADCLVFLSNGHPQPAEMMLRAEAAAKRALAIDPSLAEAHASLGFVLERHHWDRQSAASEYRRAIELDPNYATAHDWYGLFLAQDGQFDAALAELELARGLDPLTAVLHFDRAWVLFLSGRYNESLAAIETGLELDAGFNQARVLRGAALAFSGRHGEANDVFAALVRASPESAVVRSYQAIGLALAGDRAGAHAAVAEVEAAAKQASLVTLHLAALQASLGDVEEAVRWLEVAEDRRVERLIWLKTDPLFAPVRHHATVKRIIARLGL